VLLSPGTSAGLVPPFTGMRQAADNAATDSCRRASRSIAAVAAEAFTSSSRNDVEERGRSRPAGRKWSAAA
jgi:hypothetical protein